MKQILLFATFIFLFASCKRDMVFETISESSPSLVVVVEIKTISGTAVTYTKVSGAQVNLYNNQADFDASAAPLKTLTSDQDGKAVFTEAVLANKGIFYVRVTSGTLTGTGTTPYMLLNDGDTSLFIDLK